VERNRDIVMRDTYGSTMLCEGDALEIVHFVGGG
jgi:thiamine biosynthesis protein ThiS